MSGLELYYVIGASIWVVSVFLIGWTRVRIFVKTRKKRGWPRKLYDLGLIAFFACSAINHTARLVWIFAGRDLAELGKTTFILSSCGLLIIAWTAIWSFITWESDAGRKEELLLERLLNQIHEGNKSVGPADTRA